MKVLLLAASLIAYANAFCVHQYGGIGEYSGECSDSVGISKSLVVNYSAFLLTFLFFLPKDFEACYARCNCWTDFPNMGGQITHEVDAQCFLHTCWCSYNQDLCPYGTLKTNPWCCTKTDGWRCRDWDCDTNGECTHRPSFKDLLEILAAKNWNKVWEF